MAEGPKEPVEGREPDNNSARPAHRPLAWAPPHLQQPSEDDQLTVVTPIPNLPPNLFGSPDAAEAPASGPPLQPVSPSAPMPPVRPLRDGKPREPEQSRPTPDLDLAQAATIMPPIDPHTLQTYGQLVEGRHTQHGQQQAAPAPAWPASLPANRPPAPIDHVPPATASPADHTAAPPEHQATPPDHHVMPLPPPPAPAGGSQRQPVPPGSSGPLAGPPPASGHTMPMPPPPGVEIGPPSEFSVPADALRASVPGVAPTAEEFAARRAHRPPEPEPTQGLPALIRKLTFGRVAMEMTPAERVHREAVAKVRRNFGGLRQVTVVNPKGGAGKTVAVLMTALTFGQNRGGYVLAWDNNETQGTLGMRAQPDFHARTVRDVLDSIETFQGTGGKVGDLSSFVRSQGGAMFDVLASDESATAGEMLTASAFRQIREIVDRFYKLIIVDTGNNVRAENWQAAIDATDQLIVTMSARGDSAETAARMLDHLEQTGRSELARSAVTVISMPATKKGLDLPAIERHFRARTRAVLTAPYERLLDSGEPIRYEGMSKATREAWLAIASAVAEGV